MKAKGHSVLAAMLGSFAGILNGLFGAGGGIMLVPMLEQMQIEPQKAHATSVAIILPMSLVTSILYLWQGITAHWMLLSILIPCGMIGAGTGSYFLRQVQSIWLRRLFGLILLYSGIRMLFFS